MIKRTTLICLAFVLLLSGCTTEKEKSEEHPDNSFIYDNSTSEQEQSNNDTETEEKCDFSKLSPEEILQELTIEEKIGQMLMLSLRRWDNSAVQSTIPKELANHIQKKSVGNIILFAENISSPEDTVRLTHSLNDSLAVDIPMFIGIDQEGGNVVRLSHGCSLTGNMALGAIGKEEDAYLAGKITGEQLLALGINLNLAPTLDVNNNPQNPVINIRSFSENPHLVATLGASMIKGMQETGISACAKHFPGHGDTTVDSHYGLSSITKTYDEIKEMELIPFQRAIDSGIDMIMTAHIQFPKIESEERNGLILPSTLSEKIIKDILKGDMEFEGVVITDSMQMEAIYSHFSMEEASIMAINAGVDIILMPVYITNDNKSKDLENLIEALKEAVKNGKISEERINDAVLRILKVKKNRGLWDNQNVSVEEKIIHAKATVGNKEHKKAERDLAAKAITVLEDKSGNLFSDLYQNGNIIFFAPSKSIKQTVEFSLNRLKDENKADIFYQVKEYSDFKKSELSNYDGIVILTDTTTSWDTKNALEIYNNAINAQKRVAVISCRLPYDTALFPLADCLLVCYCPKGGVPQSQDEAFGVNIPGAIEVLLGASKGEGKLPITIYSVTENGKFDFSKIIYEIGYKK